MLHKMPLLNTIHLNNCIYLEVAKSLDTWAIGGFAALDEMVLTKGIVPWKDSSIGWLRSLEAALQQRPSGGRLGAPYLLWEEPPE